jgi:hypothetical protein
MSVSAGYGRGYYGSAQLAPRRQSNGRGWFTIAAVAGLGAAIWWWVLPAIGPKGRHEPPSSPSSSPPSSPSLPSSLPSSRDEELSRQAQERGFSSAKEYEEAIASMARDLRSTGAKVEMAPHLAHLEPRPSEGS